MALTFPVLYAIHSYILFLHIFKIPVVKHKNHANYYYNLRYIGVCAVRVMVKHLD